MSKQKGDGKSKSRVYQKSWRSEELITRKQKLFIANLLPHQEMHEEETMDAEAIEFNVSLGTSTHPEKAVLTNKNKKLVDAE